MSITIDAGSNIERLSGAAPETIEELVGRIFTEGVGAFHLGTVYIGLKHGLFAALTDRGPLRADELAAATGLDGWYVREWLQPRRPPGWWWPTRRT